MLTMVHIETALFLFSYGYSWAVTKYGVMISEYSVKLMKKKKTQKQTKIWLERIVCKIIFLPVFANYRTESSLQCEGMGERAHECWR